MELVERIKEIAKNKKGWSLKETDQHAGIGENSIYRWKKQVPNMNSLAKVADVLGVSVDELRGIDQKETITNTDLEEMLDTAHSYDGKIMTEHDREIIKSYLKGYFEGKN